MRARAFACICVATVLPRWAHAQADARVHADDVTLEGRSQVLSLSGHVDVEADPFHVTSDHLEVVRTRRGLKVTGDGRIAFCPCLGEPVAVAFPAAVVAPPGDLFLTRPRLEIAGVPVFWLPYFWLRSPSRVGLLAPEVSYRGADGVFLGEGLHLPWRDGDGKDGLDLRAGGYVLGGAAVEGTLRTPSSVTTMRWDDLGTSGLAVDARGALATERTSVAWDADLLRGARGVESTTDLDAAARVYDRAAAEASLHFHGDGGWVLAAGVWTESLRGSGLSEVDAAGPVVRARSSGAIGGAGAYDVTAEGGSVSGAGLAPYGNLAFGRADAGVLLASRLGPLGASFAWRGATDVLNDNENTGGPHGDQGYDAAMKLRGRLALPVGRVFVSDDPSDPWRHRIEPELVVEGLGAQGDGLAGDLTSAGGERGAVGIAAAGVSTTLGRWAARRGLEAAVDVGGASGQDEPSAVLARWRFAGSTPFVGLGAEGADLLPPSASASRAWGHAMAGRLRLGPERAFHVGLLVAGRDGVDPVLARALTDAPLAASSGFLATTGWTSGARATVPITTLVTARAGGDVDLTAQKLVGVRGSLEVHDKCQCLALRLSAAERLGRDGVDVWVSVDLAPRYAP